MNMPWVYATSKISMKLGYLELMQCTDGEQRSKTFPEHALKYAANFNSNNSNF